VLRTRTTKLYLSLLAQLQRINLRKFGSNMPRPGTVPNPDPRQLLNGICQLSARVHFIILTPHSACYPLRAMGFDHLIVVGGVQQWVAQTEVRVEDKVRPISSKIMGLISWD